MNLRNVVICGIGLMMSVGATAQINILNAKTPQEIGIKTEAQIAYDNLIKKEDNEDSNLQ